MINLHKRITPYILCLSLFLVNFLTGCAKSSTTTMATSKPLVRTQFILGTAVTIKLYDKQSEEILDKAFAKLSELENTLSINKTNTLIDKVNAQAGKSPVAVDDETFNLIKKGLYYSELTDGAFDITIGPLVQLWHIGFSDAKIPTQAEIDAVLPLINYEYVTLDETSKTVYLEKEGMMLDLGGIAKGYAADEIALLLKSNGVNQAIIDLGGNIYTLGRKDTNKSWTIGVQDPANPRGATLGTIPSIDQSLVTSGIYERYLETEDGTKYHHILNPKTGYPYNNEIVGVTILSNTSIDADALSTAAFALGVDKGLAFIESLENIDAIFITSDNKLHITSDLKSIFNLTHTNYTSAS